MLTPQHPPSSDIIARSVTGSFKALALGCCRPLTTLQTPGGGRRQDRSGLKALPSPLPVLYDSKLISEPCRELWRALTDRWMENESHGMISSSNKPEGLIANIPHFRVNYSLQIYWGENQPGCWNEGKNSQLQMNLIWIISTEFDLKRRKVSKANYIMLSVSIFNHRLQRWSSPQ